MKKDLVLSSVQNSVSSIFSKEDVINLIEKIEEEQVKSKLSIDQLMDILLMQMAMNFGYKMALENVQEKLEEVA